MKQTAVEWLEQEIFRRYKFTFQKLNCQPLDEAIAQAKEIEKQQIINTFNEGWLQCNVFELPERSRAHFETPEQYYNETFNK